MSTLEERLANMTPVQRAMFALQETQNRLDALQRRLTEPIAIVGMACRFPGGATSPEAFWRLLCEGRDAIGDVPADRWDADAFYDPDPAAPGKMVTRRGGFLPRVDEFDNHFFGISGREAARIDPQQRLLLELAWEAFEDAGLPPAQLRGAPVGVFIGIAVSEYGMMLCSDLEQTGAHALTGTSLCLAANRLSFLYGLQGPSLALDTACSSSLVATHLACQSIRNGDCEAALVGGCSLLLSPIATINLTKAGFCSPDGCVRAFDAAAAGFVRSEGGGMVVLKPLSAALKNRDPIYAVIRGSAVNQNGSSNGLTAPSRAAQEQVLREAYARSRVSPGQVQFVEAQGTGTPLGDVIETLALGNVLRRERPEGRSCALGAVKTNLGHLEAASGIASLMKTALVLKHQQIPPNLHFQTPNPDIPFQTLPLRVPSRLEPWPPAAHPRYAGVSAFGFGGSNAHAVLEEPPASEQDEAVAEDGGDFLLPLSARTEPALRELAARYRRLLAEDSASWADVCYTAAVRREHHDWRLAVLAETRQQAGSLLEHCLSGHASPQLFAGQKPFGREAKIAFLYGDQAAIWKPYAAGLMTALPGWAEALREVDAACQRIVGWSPAQISAHDPRWEQATWADVASVALQLVLTAWWRALGIVPAVVLGRGAGELAAAVAAGILTAEEALQLVADRSASNGSSRRLMPAARQASLPFLSSLDGAAHAGTDLGLAHWQACLKGPGDLACVLRTVAARRVDAVLEIGPASLLESCSAVLPDPLPAFVASLAGAERQDAGVHTAIGALYAVGADPRWKQIAPATGRCVRLPTYPWQRQRLWLEGKYRLVETPAVEADDKDAAVPGNGLIEQLAAPTVRPRPMLNAPYLAPQTSLEIDLARAWSEILHIERVGVYDNFFELGGDSLQATMLLNRLNDALGQPVPGQVLFRVQNIHDLAAYLRAQCPRAVRQRYPDEVVDASSDPARDALSADRPGWTPVLGETNSATIIPMARDRQAEATLARLQDLSDDEVASLLAQETARGELFSSE
jgi:acyl transferase domain-containing protein/acyl carrier protein